MYAWVSYVVILCGRVCVCGADGSCQLDKAYDPEATEDDMVERYEEMNRMREHVMTEIDKNRDRLISLEEFLESTRQDEFKKDEAWEVMKQIGNCT